MTAGTWFSLQLASCFFMTGLIWMVQLVHYPSFAYISERQQEFAAFHSRRITWIVAPVMAVELVSAAVLWLVGRSELWLLNLVGIGAIWLSTALLSVPCHQRLQSSFDAKTVQRLVRTNWPRTILWTLRAACLLWALT